MFIEKLHDLGVRSDAAYAAAAGSIVFSVLSWALARGKSDKASAERWGIFIGLWAPTFMQIGNALRLEERG